MEWEFTLMLPRNYDTREEIDWTALLPAENMTRWIALDEDRKYIEIDPAAGVPDLI